MTDITQKIWQYFEEICRIPRTSKNEEKICDYLKQFAEKEHLAYKQDAAGNVLILKPAVKDKENLKTVILQSHVDMVGEKNSDVQHDFLTEPINAYIDGDWMKARGTTLGADDGIGMAAAVAILADPTIEHGPLEALFTVDEETGLTGAKALEENFMTGEILINLDSEDEGELFIGCAGGIDTTAVFRYTTTKIPANARAFQLSITGLTGGHSGDDIDKGRGNAIKILNQILLKSVELFGISLARFEGGNLRNAIPREASAIVIIDPVHYNKFEQHALSIAGQWKESLITTSPGFHFSIDPYEKADTIIDINTLSGLLNAIEACPSGVIRMSETMPGLVSTSTNLASVKFTGTNTITIATSQRSDDEKAKKEIARHIHDIFEIAGATVTHSDGYPGWTPNPQSPILEITKTVYSDLFSKQPIVRAIHAGLECGLFLEKYPTLDMISFGPTIKGAHSPSEQLNIPTVKQFADLLLGVLGKIPEKNYPA
ncbi:MAG: aminoacyl-histidine dipeptidase [Bacteroidales bacterium]|jgi:dipeptidase D|nr:aminoacyl-histidine dipeptidase [Bacteroidales bacterium]